MKSIFIGIGRITGLILITIYLLISMRLLSFLFLALCALIWGFSGVLSQIKRQSNPGKAAEGISLKRSFMAKSLVLAGVILIPLLPFDVSLQNREGPPRFVPLIMGLPTATTMERAKRGEVITGGCIVSGFEPKWILVW